MYVAFPISWTCSAHTPRPSIFRARTPRFTRSIVLQVKKVQGIDLPVWAVYIVQTTVFGGGLLGISYGIISTSFDEQREGSFLGWNEFKTNLPQVLSSLGGGGKK